MAAGKWAARIVAALIVVAATPTFAAVMSLAEFRLEVRDAVLRLRPKTRFEFVGEDTLKVITGAKKDGSSIYLETAYARYLNNPEDYQTIIDQYARAALASDKDTAVATPDNLVVLIRPVEYTTQPGSEAMKLVSRPFAGDFVEIVAVDTDETFQLAKGDELAPLFADQAALWDRAQANTKAKIGRLDIETLSPGVWVVSADSNLALNIVDNPDLWSVNGLTLSGDPAAVFLRRNLLLLFDAGDKDRLQKVSVFLDHMASEPETFSTTIFTRRNGVWSVLEQRP